MKSNIEYLREDISKIIYLPLSLKNQLYEWIDAIEQNDLKEKKEAKKSEPDLESYDDRDETIAELQEELEELEDSIITIDCGIGEIKYLQPENIKLQCLMDDFKDQHERSKQTLELFKK